MGESPGELEVGWRLLGVGFWGGFWVGCGDRHRIDSIDPIPFQIGSDRTNEKIGSINLKIFCKKRKCFCIQGFYFSNFKAFL